MMKYGQDRDNPVPGLTSGHLGFRMDLRECLYPVDGDDSRLSRYRRLIPYPLLVPELGTQNRFSTEKTEINRLFHDRNIFERGYLE